MTEVIDVQGLYALLIGWAMLFLYFGYCLGRIGKVKDILGKFLDDEEVKNEPNGDSATGCAQTTDAKH
jgi:hypothetical protein